MDPDGRRVAGIDAPSTRRSPSHPSLWNLWAGPDVGVSVDAVEGAAVALAEEDDEDGGAWVYEIGHRRQQREIDEFNGDTPIADRGRGEDEDNNKICRGEERRGGSAEREVGKFWS